MGVVGVVQQVPFALLVVAAGQGMLRVRQVHQGLDVDHVV